MIGGEKLSIDIDDEWGKTAPFYLVIKGNGIIQASIQGQFFTFWALEESRTPDLSITNRMLYHLSYQGIS